MDSFPRRHARACRGHPRLSCQASTSKAWMAGTSPAMTRQMRADRLIIPLDALCATDASRVGPKAANLAALARAGLPTPGGFCLTADAYLAQVAALGLDEAVSQFATADPREQRRLSVEIRLALYEQPLTPDVVEPLRGAWHAQRAASGKPCAVRSSALIEDRKGANFAGQFESFLGIGDEAAFLTAVRACRAAPRTPHSRRPTDKTAPTPPPTPLAPRLHPP